MDVICDGGRIHLTTGEAVDRKNALFRIAVRTDVTLIDENDRCKARWTLNPIEHRYVRVNLPSIGTRNRITEKG
jgi:hypothetical protein